MFQIFQTSNIDAVERMHKLSMPKDHFDNEPGSVHWLIKLKDGTLKQVGFASLRPVYGENAVFLSAAGVIKEMRGHGLQRKLIHVRCRWARAHGFKWALTYTMKDNYFSYRNLQKCGFELYPPDNHYRGRNVLYWRKEL